MNKGGKRPGAGRPRGGKYGENTKLIRIPISKVDQIMKLVDLDLQYRIPLYSSCVQAGFPSPADDYIEKYLDLNELLIEHPAATFFVVAQGDSMIKAGIHSGDKLIVDRSIEPTHGKIVIAVVDGELTVKRLSHQYGKVRLVSENDAYKPIDITENQELAIWGVVTNVIHSLK